MNRLLGRRDVFAWCLYDWASSTFSTSIITVLMPIYFAGLFADPKAVTLCIGRFRWATNSEVLWLVSNAIYMLLAALTAPVLGAMADYSRRKKRFLIVCVLLAAAFTAGLSLTSFGHFVPAAVLFMAAAFFWSAGNVFYDGFLPELTEQPSEMDAISSYGYCAGYLGGGLVLAANWLTVLHWPRLGLADESAAIRVSFIVVALWWVAFTVPLILLVRERGAGRGRAAGPSRSAVRQGFARLAHTLRKIRRLPELARFLVAFLFYHSGIGTLMIVVAGYAKNELNLPAGTIIGCILAIQFVAMPAALVYLWLARRLGNRNSIFIGLAVFVAAIICAMRIHTAAQFWGLSMMVALVIGGTQAISRSLYGSMIPAGMSAEFYGFFSVFNKIGTFAGPAVFAVARMLTGDSRRAILFLISFFVVGAAILLTVRVGRGIEQAKTFVDEQL